MDGHAPHLMVGAGADTQTEKTDELMAAVAKLIRRG
jgi:hypothetical protein